MYCALVSFPLWHRILETDVVDGGGVRGLSSLLVLRELLCMVREEIDGPEDAFRRGKRSAKNTKPMEPTEVFDLVVGTSTGG